MNFQDVIPSSLHEAWHYLAHLRARLLCSCSFALNMHLSSSANWSSVQGQGLFPVVPFVLNSMA
jgi:hypothetical protein